MAEKVRMSTRATERLVREGDFVAEVDVHLIEADGGWMPYLELVEKGDRLLCPKTQMLDLRIILRRGQSGLSPFSTSS